MKKKDFYDSNENYKKLRNRLNYEDGMLLIQVVSDAMNFMVDVVEDIMKRDSKIDK